MSAYSRLAQRMHSDLLYDEEVRPLARQPPRHSLASIQGRHLTAAARRLRPPHHAFTWWQNPLMESREEHALAGEVEALLSSLQECNERMAVCVSSGNKTANSALLQVSS